MSEDKLYQDSKRAAEARMLLDNPLLKETFTYAEQSIVDDWKSSGDPNLHHSLKAFQKIKDRLMALIRDGHVADAEIERVVKRQKREKKYAT